MTALVLRRSLPIAAFAGLLFAATGAQAGGFGCETCYKRVVTPPVYGTVAESVMVRPPRTFHQVVPAAYETVAERVLVSPGRKVWQVSTNAYGETVGCWVHVPPQYGVVHRRVLVRPPEVVAHTVPAAYATRHRSVLVSPGSASWQPVGRRGYGGYDEGYGAGYGGGYRSAGGFVGGAVDTAGAIAGGAVGGALGAIGVDGY